MYNQFKRTELDVKRAVQFLDTLSVNADLAKLIGDPPFLVNAK